MEVFISLLICVFTVIWTFYGIKYILRKETYISFIVFFMATGIGFGLFFTLLLVSNNILKDINVLFNILTILLLWLTFLGALWAAKESFDLKKSSLTQNEYELRPFLRLQWNGSEDSIIELVNDGRGIAYDVIFEEQKFEDGEVTTPLQIKKRPTIRAGGVTKVSYNELISQNDAISTMFNDRDMISHLSTKILAGLTIKCTYFDLVRNKYYAEFVADLDYNDKFRIEKQEKII